jgi:F-type H+-transporting ATPase subunit a
MKVVGIEWPVLGYTQISLTNLGVFCILVFGISCLIPLIWETCGLVLVGIQHNHKSLIVRSLIESMVQFVLNLVKIQVGLVSLRWYPPVFSLFVFILLGNLIGLIPYSYCVTAQFGLCFSLSFTILIGVTILGVQIQGIRFLSFFVPSGCPLNLVPLLVMIESISYLARSLSLGLRLSANLIAGHILLKIFSIFAWKIIKSGTILALVLSPVSLISLVLLFSLEFGVAFIQAYVFILLTLSYLADVIYLHSMD